MGALLRCAVVLLASMACVATFSGAWAQVIKVMETGPADRAVIDRPPEGFFVRFDKPVDHLRSVLVIKRDGKEVATLHPRFKTEPQLLFAVAPPLPAGEYTLTWSVITLEGAHAAEGEISFTIGPTKRQ